MKANGLKIALFASVLIAGMFGQAPAPVPTSGEPAPEATNNDADTPNRAVARISIINGVVSVRRGDSGDAVAAALNAPLTSADRLLTGEGSRAEIQFDAVNMIRLAASTEVRLGDLAYHQYQIQIAAGTTLFRVLRDNDAQIEISTPSIAIRPLKRGVYRVTVKPDGSTEVTVRSGEAEIASPKGTEKLASGKTMDARGPADNPEFQVSGAIAQDPFDKWNLDRDTDLEKSGSGRNVNPDINGTEELDAHGRWVNDPQYGQVWVPTVDPGWAPYQVGRWVWVDYYGWTWVSGDPWGWAPYHYGRWYMGSFGWAWWPGPVYGPYYWRPALVGFFGWGPGIGFGVGFGFGFGNVGWVALAPYERFSPWYGAGIYGRGFGNVAITRGVNVTNVYRNARVANGVTSMASSNFGRAGVNAANNVRASAADLSRAGAVRGAMPIAPSRESTHYSNASASSLHSSENSHFYSTRSSTSSAASHVSFDQQRQAMTRAASTAPSSAARSAASASSTHQTSGWQRASSPSSASAPSSSSSGNTSAVSRHPAATNESTSQSNAGHTEQSSAGGWQRFNGNNSGSSSSTASRPTAGNGSQAVRINPSVVQSRTSSSSSSGSSGSSRSAGSSSGSRGSSGSRSGGGGRR